MAEALWNHLAAGTWEAFSAGSKPAGYVNKGAIAAMAELGIDIGDNASKSVAEFRDQPFDLVITVCDHAREVCPVFPGAKETLHWPFDDPYYAKGSAEEIAAEFRRVRDEIRVKIGEYLKRE